MHRAHRRCAALSGSTHSTRDNEFDTFALAWRCAGLGRVARGWGRGSAALFKTTHQLSGRTGGDLSITQFKAQGPSRTCNESKEEEAEEEDLSIRPRGTPDLVFEVWH